MDLDPAVFGDISSVAVFSPSGDAQGYADVSQQHVDVHFYSPSKWLGAVPDTPMLAVWVPVLASAVAGAKTAVTIDPAGSTLFDSLGSEYTLAVTPGTFTVGGGLAIESVTPGGGMVPAQTPIQIMGTGFDSGTSVSIDGASVLRTEYVSPQQVNVTLNAATELTGKHFRIVDGSGEHLDYYAALSSAPIDPPDGFTNDAPGVQLIVPLATLAALDAGAPSDAMGNDSKLALLNPNLTPTDVTIVLGPNFGAPEGSSVFRTIAIPPGALYFLQTGSIAYRRNLYLFATQPIRSLEYQTPGYTAFMGAGPTTLLLSGIDPGFFPPIGDLYTPDAISWSWQSGAAPPAPATRSYTTGFRIDGEGAPWLGITPKESASAGDATFSVTSAASSLAAGTHNTSVTVTPVLSGALAGLPVSSREIDLSLTVTVQATLETPGLYSFDYVPQLNTGGPPVTQEISVVSNGEQLAFNTFVDPGSGSWLSVSPSNGRTPAKVKVTVNPAGFGAGNYLAGFTIYGLNSTIHVPVGMALTDPSPVPPPYTGPLALGASSLDLKLPAGTTSSDEWVGVQPGGVSATVSVATASGTNWLSAVYSPLQETLIVTANATGLAAGTHHGTVTVVSESNGSAQLPVNLEVLAVSPDPLTVTPASLSLTGGGYATGQLTLASGSGLLPFTVKTENPAKDFYLVAIPSATARLDNTGGGFTTPATVGVAAGSSTPGVHSGKVIIKSPNGTVTVPVTLTVPESDNEASWPPVMADVASAADHASGAITPGEIAMILGTWIGPAPANMQIGGDGKVTTTLNGTQVLIDGVAAPLIYADHNLINLIVPYETPTVGFATVRVMTNGQETATWGVPVAPSAPGIFTLTLTGIGQAAVLNADNTVNGSASPAARGTPVQIFATGEGATTPSGITGELTGLDVKKPLLPVKVTIGGIEAKLDYFGSAPDAVAGLFQVNAVVPDGVTPGPAVPVVVSVGDARSPDSVTIAVK